MSNVVVAGECRFCGKEILIDESGKNTLPKFTQFHHGYLTATRKDGAWKLIQSNPEIVFTFYPDELRAVHQGNYACLPFKEYV